MAAAKLILLASVAVVALGDYVEVPMQESNDRPTQFRDGLVTYVKVAHQAATEDESATEDLFKLCTSCTISYIIGTTNELDSFGEGTSENMVLREGLDPIKITFYE